jgi:hypothetical protein
MAIEAGHVQPKDHAALLGIGSGVNVLMLALDWQESLVGGKGLKSSPPLVQSKPSGMG